MKTTLILISLIFSMSTFANETIKVGVIKESTCNTPSGLGYLILEQKDKKTITREAIKINSKELCGLRSNHSTALSDISFKTIFFGKTDLYEVVINDGFATAIYEIEPVDYLQFVRKVKKYSSVNIQETESWFYKGPNQISYNHSSEEIKQLVEKYTTR